MNEKKFKAIPANACLMSVGEFQIGDNGETAKTAPISLIARSGKAIEHWFWGKVAHDLSGVIMSKPRIAIDYCHDDKEVIGYLNKFDSASGDFITAGALVPFKESDRATEIIFKMKAGVPYQASINFGGDGIEVEEVLEGMSAEVNGYTLDGPACIIRKWPCRGVAICPYGADENTEAVSFSDSSKTFSATVASATPSEVKEETTKEETMKDKSVEVVEEVVTEATEEMKEEVKAVETVTEEVAPVEAKPEAQAVEVQAVETEKPQEEVPAVSTDVEVAQAELEDLKKKKVMADKELESKEILAKLAQEKAQVEAELADTKRKLSAFQKGETVLSSMAEPSEKTSGSPWADAQKRKQ